MKTPQERSVDPASIEMLSRLAEDGVPVIWDRYDQQQPQCGFGMLGICCRNCSMGPCRIDPFGEGPSEGICGATADVIAARNLARMIAAGTSAHSDHARDVTHALKLAAEGSDYVIKDERKLRALAAEWGIETKGRDTKQIATDLAEAASAQFGQQEGQLRFVSRAPEDTQKRWRKADVVPRGIDREVVDLLHRTHVGG
ncbi:MAG: carbon monoxide dehydrogenase, partial [Planctomycetes bacterium]|nr:carbon monoxide dehydrogenase [Planctomycetota bacterium]